ncbi:MAG: YgfZ/GcvT domain-containing protein [Gemmataceae bacterium]
MSALLFDFSAHGTLEATGDDARTFLHNLSTNDVKTLPEWHGREAFFLTATAKVVGQGWVWRQPPAGKAETLWIDTPAGQGGKLFLHLKRFIIGEDVELSDRSIEHARLYLAGPDAAALLEVAPAALTFTPADGLVVRRRDLLGVPGYDIIGPADRIDAARVRLVAQGVAEADAATFDVMRVEAGLPLYGADIDETTFAPETGRIAQAISYNKGCYLGQEPVVMARDRGVVQRTLVGLELGDEPATGALTKDGAEVGKVTSAVFSRRLGRAIGLGYAKRGSQTPGTELRLGERPVKVAALPFA